MTKAAKNTTTISLPLPTPLKALSVLGWRYPINPLPPPTPSQCWGQHHHPPLSTPDPNPPPQHKQALSALRRPGRLRARPLFLLGERLPYPDGPVLRPRGVRLPVRRKAHRVHGPVVRGLHSSTSRLNLSAFVGIGGAFRGCLGGVRGYQGVFKLRICVRNGSG